MLWFHAAVQEDTPSYSGMHSLYQDAAIFLPSYCPPYPSQQSWQAWGEREEFYIPKRSESKLLPRSCGRSGTILSLCNFWGPALKYHPIVGASLKPKSSPTLDPLGKGSKIYLYKH